MCVTVRQKYGEVDHSVISARLVEIVCVLVALRGLSDRKETCHRNMHHV